MPLIYDVSIVIVHYNGLRYLKNLFDSIIDLRTGDITFEVVLVDNGSTDGSVEFLKKEYVSKLRNLKIVTPGKNLGFAEGNNYGVKHSEGQYVVFLNNDTKVHPNWLIALFNAIHKRNDVGLVTSKLLFFYDYIKVSVKTNDKVFLDKKIVINGEYYETDSKFCKNLLYEENRLVCFGHSCFYIPIPLDATFVDIEIKALNSEQKGNLYIEDCPFETLDFESFQIMLSGEQLSHFRISLIQNAGSGINEQFNGFDVGFCEEDSGQYESVRELTSACGASMMMRREEFLDLGGFDSYFFMYYEDTDLSFRVKNRNKKILYIPDSIVRHIHTGSSKEWSPFFIYHVYRNRLLFIFKNFSLKVFLKEWIRFVLHVSRSWVKSNDSKPVKQSKLKALWNASIQLPRYIAQSKRYR